MSLSTWIRPSPLVSNSWKTSLKSSIWSSVKPWSLAGMLSVTAVSWYCECSELSSGHLTDTDRAPGLCADTRQCWPPLLRSCPANVTDRIHHIHCSQLCKLNIDNYGLSSYHHTTHADYHIAYTDPLYIYFSFPCSKTFIVLWWHWKYMSKRDFGTVLF